MAPNEQLTSERSENASAAEAVDPRTGVVERIEYLKTDRGRIYAWSGKPPKATTGVIISSPVSADFTANYHRERLLALALVERGISAVRFHYLGDGNSDGEMSDLTFESICADASDVLENFMSTLFSDRFAVFGSRIGALVACALANSHPASAVALWEPVGNPHRFFEEGGRSRRLSNLARADGEAGESWREELARAGVLDLVGFSVYPPLVSSLDSLDMTSIRVPAGRRTMMVDFGGSRKQVSAWLSQQETAVDVLKIGMAESWWFQDDHMRSGADEVIAATVDWLAGALGESGQ